MKIEHHFKQLGAGPPVVFLHGSYATSSTWKKMVGQLAETHLCIAIDLPGHGGSPGPDDFSDPTVETELSFVEKIVTELTDEPIHLVGHSYGGVVALALALDGRLPVVEMTLFEPVAVSALGSTDAIQPMASLHTFLLKYRESVRQNTPHACGQVIDFWCGEGAFAQLPGFIKDSMEPMTANNIRHWDLCVSIDSSSAILQKCLIPTRIVYGTDSHPLAHAIAEKLHSQMSQSKTYIIEGASHFLVTSHVDECVAVVRDRSLFKK